MSKVKHLGVIENILASFIFFSPNFLFWFVFFKQNMFIFFLYNLIIIFLLVSTISHLKYNKTENIHLRNGINNIIEKLEKEKKEK